MKVGLQRVSKTMDSTMPAFSAVTAIDDSLVEDCLGGDPEAWRGLHRRYYPVAVAFLRKLGSDEGEIEDACQEVFVELFKYLPTFRGQADLKTWLYRLCVTQARRIRNRSRLLRAIRDRLESDRTSLAVPAATVTESSLLAHMKSALDRMNEGDRLVFVLYEFEGLPGKQIAKIANCPETTVWRRLHYARRIFRDTLGMHMPEAVGDE